MEVDPELLELLWVEMAAIAKSDDGVYDAEDEVDLFQGYLWHLQARNQLFPKVIRNKSIDSILVDVDFVEQLKTDLNLIIFC